jgi:anti-anti-sigma factor
MCHDAGRRDGPAASTVFWRSFPKETHVRADNKVLHPQVSTSSRFGVTRRREDDAVVLAVSGAVDEVTAPSLATDLDVVLMGEPTLLVIDLTAVEFMSSAGMNLLIETQRLTASTATTVRVAADGTATSRPMRFIGIDRIIELYPTVDEALRGRQRPAEGAGLHTVSG